MKKVLILACAALTACTNDIDLGPNKEQVETLSNAIGFQMAKKNMTTTKADQTLQSQGHYNFGVWGYKAVTAPAVPTIMENYLVGYMDDTRYKGYFMTSANQTTLGDASNSKDGQSQWAYEKLGSSEYGYTGTEGYYTASQTQYKSNNANQYLRFWDHSSASTNFYAYAPYVNGAKTVTFDNGTKIMTFPNGSMKAGYDEASQFEYMYAGVSVPKANYRKDVQLKFKRMSSRIRVKFWEDIPGYQIKIISLNDATSSSSYTGDVYATPVTPPTTTTVNPITYPLSKYAVQASATVDFSTDVAKPTLKITAEDASKSGTSLHFKAPAGDNFTYPTAGTPETSGKIGEERNVASQSATVYYGIPAVRGSYEVPGFIFHVSYELTSTTGEKITVRNAKVYVPQENCQWKPNYSYTYIFKITKKSNGSTDNTIPPTDPDNDHTIDKDEKALFPIVFDGCTVEDYETEIENDYTISDPSAPVYTLSLKDSSVKKDGSIIGTANSTTGGTTTTATSSNISVEAVSSGCDASKITVAFSGTGATNNVTVTAQADAPAGTYKLVYKNASDEVVATVTFTVTD